MASILARMVEYVLLQSWQIALVFILVAITCRLLRSVSAHWRYALWLVVLAKCLVPPLLAIPLTLLPAGTMPGKALDRWLQTKAGSNAGAVPETTTPTTKVGKADPTGPGSMRTADPTIAADARNANVPSGPRAPVTLWEWLAAAWAMGAVLLMMVAGIRAERIQRYLRRDRRAAPKPLADEIATLGRQLGMASIPTVWLVDGIAQPFVWGVLRGSIYLPGRFHEAGTVEDRRSILMHELAHVARYDAAVNLLQILAQATFFFHPLVWWANKRIRQEREKCCDEVAIAHLNASPHQYSEAIVNSLIREYESTRPISSLAVAGPVRNIEERIKTIMNPHMQFHHGPSRLAVGSTLLLAVILAPSALVVRAQGETPAGTASAPASQPSPSVFFDTILGLETYPSSSPDQLVEEMVADLLSDKWHSQDGDFASLTLRNPAPEREARISVHEQVAATAGQKQLLFDAPMSYISISGHDKETVIVDATVFVRSSTSAEAARAYAQKIEVELAPSDDYVRLGEHVLKLKPKDIEEAGVLYTVKVPRRFGVDARMRNGRLSATGIAGEFRYIGGGALIATYLRGQVRIDKTGGGTLLANVPGPQSIRIDQPSGLIGLINIAAPIQQADLRGAVYLDLRKVVPAGMNMEIGRTNYAKVILGPGTTGNLAFTAQDGVLIHQPDGSVLPTSAFTQQPGSGGSPVEIRMTSGGKLHVWVGAQLKTPS